MNITITKVSYDDKLVLSNIIQLYRYDSSEFDGHALNSHGLYMYKYLDNQWTDDYRYPAIIKVDGEIAGFVLIILDVPKDFTKLSKTNKTNVISDFFILRKFRRKGIGKQVAFSIFDQFKGDWEVKQTLTNKPAYEFWKKVIGDYTNGFSYHEEVLKNEQWTGPVFNFKSGEE
ncbi:GNAT family N-acetyltransferase [Gracilibacillus oryzae]|uniref:GNAT family N-acetyltransferase n=1 Tax=Gracilibacillus oryzae TaxID=1672701 RepID=A0A7C8L738_9BACI|nr:GNAT family N-acetyltransferase [Gracilibacillus oryzae]KAB8135739.1 GNAT family N-acetyltransferase [Gracilibacillus oryzae]